MANFSSYEWFLPSSVSTLEEKKATPTKNNKSLSLVGLCSAVVARNFQPGFRSLLPSEVLELVQKRMAREAQVKYLNEFKKWNKDGKLEALQTFNEEGLPHGDYLVWYRNGKPKMRVSYQHGARHGLCQWWLKDGRLEASEHYEEGRLWPQTMAAAH